MLRSAASALERSGAGYQDWQDAAQRTVLVDPFLYPLIFGRSRVLPDTLIPLEEFADRSGEGVVVPIPSEYDATILTMEALIFHEALNEPYSRKFQWLPSDVDISGNDGSVK